MTMVLMALGAVAAGVALFVLVLAVAGPKTSKQAQTATFKVGSAKSLAGTVARTGPLLFQDLLGGSRDIYVQHLDDDTWTAFEAHAPGQPRTCFLRWQPQSRTFVDPCSGLTYPADGAGLVTYPAGPDRKGALVVDLTAGASR
jgi:hypothetical protein